VTDTAAPSRRRENTRTRLMDAAATVFAEIGIDAASVEAVSERAGFTRGAFYSNFASKEELLLALCGRSAQTTIAAVRARVHAIESRDLTTPDQALRFVREVLEVAGNDRLDVLLNAELRVQALRSSDLARAYLALHEGLASGVSQLVLDIAERSGLPLRVPADEATELLLSAWISSSERLIMTGQEAGAVRGELEARLARLVPLLLG